MFLELKANATKPKEEGSQAWVYWVASILTIVTVFIIVISVWEIINRYRARLRNQKLMDGGPPATPSHSFSYMVGVHAERCSPSLDRDITVVKVELLDRLNRYITSVAVPVFLFKLKVDEGPPPDPSTKPTHAVYIKTMTVLKEKWATTERDELITFSLTRRRPLTDVTAARILHDCYLENAYIVFKFIVFHDHAADVDFIIRCKDQQIRGIHPCPPTNVQVFPVEKLTTPAEELKAFLELAHARPPPGWLVSCLGGDKYVA